MERGRSARTTHVARVTSSPNEPSHNLVKEALVRKTVEGLCQSVGGHIVGTDML
jgi:hypothetical protein